MQVQKVHNVNKHFQISFKRLEITGFSKPVLHVITTLHAPYCIFWKWHIRTTIMQGLGSRTLNDIYQAVMLQDIQKFA